MDHWKYDGIDLDWEYPCSPARSNAVKLSCAEFQTVADSGGNCPQDGDNLVLLAQEMRAAFGPDKLVTVASQAAKENWENMDLLKVQFSCRLPAVCTEGPRFVHRVE